MVPIDICPRLIAFYCIVQAYSTEIARHIGSDKNVGLLITETDPDCQYSNPVDKTLGEGQAPSSIISETTLDQDLID